MNDNTICIDSRKCVSGSRFYAFSGKNSTVSDNIAIAIHNGAVRIITSTVLSNDLMFTALGKSIEITIVDNESIVRDLLIADLQDTHSIDYSNFTIIAVTGTDGKTSTVHFARELAAKCGHISASIGTVGIFVSNVSETSEFATTELTTPDIVTNHYMLYLLQRSGVQFAFIEYSSIGIHQNRLGSVKITGAVWTTLGTDHLDYHGNQDEYIYQKSRLCNEIVDECGFCIMNESVQRKLVHMDISIHMPCTVIKYPDIHYTETGIIFAIDAQNIQTQLFADFLAENMNIAIATLLQCGISLAKIAQHSNGITAPVGRFECITQIGKQLCIVDYAHTAQALQKLLDQVHTTRNNTGRAKIWLVVGAGGDRDPAKRAQFGRIASQMCDYCIVTDDNPRTENPDAIRAAIIAGMKLEFIEQGKMTEIGDRAAAIAYAIAESGPNDIIVCAGKGHEQYQIIGSEKIHLSDQTEIRKYLVE